MTTSIPFDGLSLEYAAGVRAIYGAARGTGVAERAAATLGVSRAVNGSGAEALEAPDPAARAWAGARLLAKSLTDVDVALALLDTASASDEASPAVAERFAGVAPVVEAQLGLLVAALGVQAQADHLYDLCRDFLVSAYEGLFLAGLYLALSGYVLLTGADFVDAPHMPRLDRVPGVRRLVAALGNGEEAR